MKPIRLQKKFPECEDCINKECDPFRCENCVNGDHYEGEGLMDGEFMGEFSGASDAEELTYAEFIDLFGKQG